MRVADAITAILAEGGVRHTFGIPGLHTLTLHDALLDEPRIRQIGTSTEAAAAYAADGYARVTGEPGVILTTSGVAAFNALGGLSEADIDGAPLLLLAGQIPAGLIGKARGFLHETDDQAAAFAPACGYIARPRSSEAVIRSVAEALRHLARPHARPAYVELPTDLLDEVVAADAHEQPSAEDAGSAPTPAPRDADAMPDPDAVERAGELLSRSRKPLIVAGGAVTLERAGNALLELATTIGAPILHTVPGRGSIPPGHALDAGPLVAGHGASAGLLAAADTILIAGDRMDEQTTAAWSLGYGGRVIQLHPREEWLGRSLDVEVAIGGAVGDSIAALLGTVAATDTDPGTTRGNDWPDAAAVADASRAALRDSVQASARPWLEAMDTLRSNLPPSTIVTSDAAAIDTWTAYFWEAAGPGTSLFPWGSAALGYGLPAAIGASVGAPGAPVLMWCGDGGFAYSAVELATAARTGANVISIVADDGGYVSIGDYQLARFGRTSDVERGGIDLVALAEACGVPGRRVSDVRRLPAAVGGLLENGGPGLIALTARTQLPWKRAG